MTTRMSDLWTNEVRVTFRTSLYFSISNVITVFPVQCFEHVCAMMIKYVACSPSETGNSQQTVKG